MTNRHDRNKNTNPRSLGILVKNKELEFLPEITEDTEIYQIQDFGGEGISYLELLDKKLEKCIVDEKDKQEIDSIVDYLAEIHKTKHKSEDKKILNAVYNDFLRNIIGHPEYLLMLLHDIPQGNRVLSPKKQGEFISLMLENMHYFKNESYRLSAIHGDFWGANVFFREDESLYVVDHSRMPWGDPGFDVGFWLSQYLINYIKTENIYFKNLGEYFLEEYLKKTGDYDIMGIISYSLGLVAVMYCSPLIVPELKDEVRKKIYDHTIEMLRKKEFFWPEY